MNKLYITVGLLLILGSCKKNLDELPLEKLTGGYVFDPRDSVGTQAQQVLYDIYSNLPNGYNRIGGNFLDDATDDALSSKYNTSIENLAQSKINASTTNPDDAWTGDYTAIRKVNLFLANVVVIPNANVKYWMAEARGLRAFFYFELLKRYGGIPLLGDTVYGPNDKIRIKRSAFADCVSYIVGECNTLASLLKTEAQIVANPGDYGRISKGVVLALKAKVLLYAASPLFNGGGADQAPTSGYPTYDGTRWTDAATAARDVMSLGSYSLDPSFSNVFLARKSPETILAYLRNITTDLETNNGPVGYGVGATGAGITSPSQELVDAFPMNDGTAIAASAIYNPATPYAKRDPRLALTVLANGANWLARPLQTVEGGLDKPNKGGTQTRTGYYLRKFLGAFETATQYSAQNHNYPILRYTEITLDFAEAQNESVGPTAEVYTVLTNIRKRAGIAAGTDGLYGLKANMTQDEMRTAIKGERRIEMAFEEQRYWDLKRWKDAATVLNNNVSGVSIAADPTTGVLSFQRITAGKTIFSAPKMYLYPIPYTEIVKNPSLVQNFGW